jgi:hypothetical protein
MNYYNTLIEVADDCPASEGQVPRARGGKKTKAVVEYDLLSEHPYTYTEEDIAFCGACRLARHPESELACGAQEVLE